MVGEIMKPNLYYQVVEKFYNIGNSWDNLAPMEEDAIEFACKNINPEPIRESILSRYSLEYYLAHFGESINERYRHDRPDDEDLETANMVALHKTKGPMVLYRGVCKKVFLQMQKNAKHIKGVDLFEKSFLQTSLVKGHESNADYHFRIYVPEGTEAVYLGDVNYERHYYEVDLQHGAKLKIISMDNKYINCKLL